MRQPALGDTPEVTPSAILHQEGVLGLIAVVGLSLRGEGALAALASAGGWAEGLVSGVAVGGGCAFVLWLLRGLGPLRALESWQRRLVTGWTTLDAVAVASLSGLAEEALMRAFLQPLVGIMGAAVLFALLHVIPDRRLWFWPVTALVIGLAFGVTFERHGYPAAAAAHVMLNGVGLLRLRRATAGDPEPGGA